MLMQYGHARNDMLDAVQFNLILLACLYV